MSNKGKTVISCTLYINNILCVKIDLSNPKHLHSKQYIYIYIERERERVPIDWGYPWAGAGLHHGTVIKMAQHQA